MLGFKVIETLISNQLQNRNARLYKYVTAVILSPQAMNEISTIVTNRCNARPFTFVYFIFCAVFYIEDFLLKKTIK